MRSGAAIKYLFLILAVLLMHAGTRAAGTPLPEGVVKVDTDKPEGPGSRIDEGYPTTAAALHGDYLWLGRDGGLRRYHKDTLEWEFFRYDNKICKGNGTINIAPDGQFSAHFRHWSQKS